MTSNDSTIKVATKTIESAQNDKITFNTLKIYNTLYITLTSYYIVNDTFRSQVMTTPQMWK